MPGPRLHLGDCLEVLATLPAGAARLAYLDPPFFTRRVHRLSPRDRSRTYSFDDSWSGREQYSAFLLPRLEAVHRVLTDDGNAVFHCDRRASHVARHLLDRVFGADRFRSEIVWHYRRWSNASRALLPAHQTLLVYSRGRDAVFNPIFVEYSPSTNLDQILQRRCRDHSGKSAYQRDDSGNVVWVESKRGVPLGDVWDIPYLNPKARERVGYPTQKPLLLLERVVEIFSNRGDLVVDPFCGSGTTLIAAERLGRRSLGVDLSKEALELCRARLANPVRTESRVVERGRQSYRGRGETVREALGDLDVEIVQRNRGIDAIGRRGAQGHPVAVRVQRADESLKGAVELLVRAGRARGCRRMVLVATQPLDPCFLGDLPNDVVAIESSAAQLERLLPAEES